MPTLTAPRTSRKASRKPLQPATGTARVLLPVGEVNATAGEIAINGKKYFIQVFSRGYRLFGWDERKAETTVYDVPADCSSCDCADHTYRGNERPGGCKHMRAIAALLAAGRIPTLSQSVADRHDEEAPF